MFVSMDGVAQAPGGEKEDTSGGFKHGGWTFPLFDEAGGKVMERIFRDPYDLLLGRRTYDIFAGYWPKHPNSETDIGRQFNRVRKYVATHRPKTLTWENSQDLGKNPVATLKKLKKGEGPRFLTQGSTRFLQSLLKADLVDEMVILTFPVTLGKGKKLFDKGTLAAGFKLTDSVVTPSGVMVGFYERAGKVKTGTF